MLIISLCGLNHDNYLIGKNEALTNPHLLNYTIGCVLEFVASIAEFFWGLPQKPGFSILTISLGTPEFFFCPMLEKLF